MLLLLLLLLLFCQHNNKKHHNFVVFRLEQKTSPQFVYTATVIEDQLDWHKKIGIKNMMWLIFGDILLYRLKFISDHVTSQVVTLTLKRQMCCTK